MKKHWRITQPDIDSVTKISEALTCSPIFAKILVNRNIKSADHALNFLNPSLQNLHPPFSLKGMNEAVHRISKAINGDEKILIFGDYDVDGITSATVLLEFLILTGADVSLYIPHRTNEGYGLQKQQIMNYALPNKVNLIITTDCGSSSHEAIHQAQQAGIDVIITDHHRISDSFPPAVALINPQRPDCSAGFEDLAGVGVAFMLIIALRKYLREMNFWHSRPEPNLKRFCDLVALGTIADAVPLRQQNRIMTRAGIDLIQAKELRPGIKALLQTSRVNPDVVYAEDIAFKIVPRLNAAGRMGHAKRAADLLVTKNHRMAREIAISLEKLNEARKETEIKILQQIQAILVKNPHLLNKKSIVLAQDNWHEGVLGIVASRLVDQYYRPVVLLSTKDGTGKGSARSIAGFDLYACLSNCSQQLENFGGHSMAAGLKMKEVNIAPFIETFEAAVQNTTKGDNLVPELLIDSELQFTDISANLLDEIESLKPFGTGNRNPLFMAQNVTVKTSQIVGERHRRMLLCQASGGTDQAFGAIHFNAVTGDALPQTYERIAFRLQWNHWGGDKTIQMIIEAAH
jgi:single-stranded-DNA-specific exonuclease